MPEDPLGGYSNDLASNVAHGYAADASEDAEALEQFLAERENAYRGEGWDEPPHMPDPAVLGRASAIIERLNSVTEQRDRLAEEEKFLRARLATLLPEGTTKVGMYSVNIRANKRFDARAARAVLTPVELELCSVVEVNSKRAKEMLSPARYAECQTSTGDPVVRVS